MKLLIILVVILSPIFANAQSSSKEIEKAYYEVNVNGETAFYTDLHCEAALFNKEQFYTLERIAMEKEGVFDVSYLDDGKIIRIAHLSYVEAETLKTFGHYICDEIELEERESYIF